MNIAANKFQSIQFNILIIFLVVLTYYWHTMWLLMFLQLWEILESLVTALLFANKLLVALSDIFILMEFLNMPLHICLDTESPITTVHSATEQLALMLKHVSIQVVLPFIAEGAVFEWANEESLQPKQEHGLRTKYFHSGMFTTLVNASNILTNQLSKTTQNHKRYWITMREPQKNC